MESGARSAALPMSSPRPPRVSRSTPLPGGSSLVVPPSRRTRRRTTPVSHTSHHDTNQPVPEVGLDAPLVPGAFWSGDRQTFATVFCGFTLLKFRFLHKKPTHRTPSVLPSSGPVLEVTTAPIPSGNLTGRTLASSF